MTPQKTNKNLYTHTWKPQNTYKATIMYTAARVCVWECVYCVYASLLLLLLLLVVLPALISEHIRVLFLSHCLLLLPLVDAIVVVVCMVPISFFLFLTASPRLSVLIKLRCHCRCRVAFVVVLRFRSLMSSVKSAANSRRAWRGVGVRSAKGLWLEVNIVFSFVFTFLTALTGCRYPFQHTHIRTHTYTRKHAYIDRLPGIVSTDLGQFMRSARLENSLALARSVCLDIDSIFHLPNEFNYLFTLSYFFSPSTDALFLAADLILRASAYLIWYLGGDRGGCVQGQRLPSRHF